MAAHISPGSILGLQLSNMHKYINRMENFEKYGSFVSTFLSEFRNTSPYLLVSEYYNKSASPSGKK